jgi:hypothetical protein
MNRCIFGILFFAGASAATAQHAPKIACDKPDYDFGTVDSTDRVTHIYEIRNAGDVPLRISEVRGSCGCTTAVVSRTTVPAGETAAVTAVFNVGGRSGHQDKHVAVYSDDPVMGLLTLNLHGDVKRDVLISPEFLTAGRIRPDQPVEMKIIVEDNSAAPLHITSASASSSNLETSVVELTPGKRFVVKVKTIPPLENGSMESVIHIFTASTNNPVYDVTFKATVLGPLVVAPPQFTLEQSSGPISRFIIINGGTVQKFSILKVETPDPAITTQQMQFGIGGVRIMVNNIVAKPELDGKSIRITTDVETMKEILVLIHVVPPAPKKS